MLSVVAAVAVVANRFLMGAAHNGTAAWPRAPPRTNDEKQTGAHQVEIDLDHYRVLMPADADLLQAEQSMCVVSLQAGPVIKIDAGATPFLGNVLESWHGDGGAHLEVLLCSSWYIGSCSSWNSGKGVPR